MKKKEMGGLVARMGKRRVIIEFWWGKLKERTHLKDLGVDGRLRRKWTSQTWDGGGAWTGFI
jgi:hypothetical protein